MVLGMISQKTRINIVTKNVDSAAPQLGPNTLTSITVTKLEIATFTKLLPINMAATIRSSLVIRRKTELAPFIPLSAKCLARILFREIWEASAAEKKKEKTANAIRIITIGMEKSMCIKIVYGY